jgi:elongator complex protein 1
VLVNEYALAVARGPTHAPDDFGAVAVIDGQTVKFTPFRTCNPPPPMAMCELEVESPVIDVAFATDCSSVAVLHRLGVSWFALEAKGPRLSSPKLVALARFETTGARLYEEALLQIAFSSRTEVQVLRMADDLELLRYDFGSDGKEWLKTDASSVATITTPSSAEIEGVVAQHLTGRISCISGGEHSAIGLQLATFLPWASFVRLNEASLAFGMSRNGHLYANSRQLAKNCTSFVVTDSHLIFTTSNHLVKFVHLASEEGMPRFSLFWPWTWF